MERTWAFLVTEHVGVGVDEMAEFGSSKSVGKAFKSLSLGGESFKEIRRPRTEFVIIDVAVKC